MNTCSYDDPDTFPPLCNHTTFCPDEEDTCQPLLRVDSPCQLNRDGMYSRLGTSVRADRHPDQCEAPPDWRKLADHSGAGRNHNGTVCLNNTCMCVFRKASRQITRADFAERWANVTVGEKCVVENTAYIAYTAGGEFAQIVSRSGSCCASRDDVADFEQ